jgi:hypothetical protein
MTDNIIKLEDHRQTPEEPTEMMVQITIYDNGDGTLWLHDFITGKEQFNWAAAKIAEVTGALLSEKAVRSGEL